MIKNSVMLVLLALIGTGFVEDLRLAEARSLVQKFMVALKGELMAGMANGGPEAAIMVCHEQAPAVAKVIASNSTWTVARRSLKPRNVANTPDEWEAKVLRAFDNQVKGGADPKAIEFAEVVEGEYRYMKAIPTAPLCLTCHGLEIPPPVLGKISSLYPEDQAVDYAVGELRGAFSLRSR